MLFNSSYFLIHSLVSGTIFKNDILIKQKKNVLKPCVLLCSIFLNIAKFLFMAPDQLVIGGVPSTSNKETQISLACVQQTIAKNLTKIYNRKRSSINIYALFWSIFSCVLKGSNFWPWKLLFTKTRILREENSCTQKFLGEKNPDLLQESFFFASKDWQKHKNVPNLVKIASLGQIQIEFGCRHKIVSPIKWGKSFELGDV